MIDLEASKEFLRTLWTEEPKREKHPDDLVRQEMLIELVKPQVVIETGLHWGYGARWWAERVPRVLTVERDAQMIFDYRKDTHGFGPCPENVVIFEGDSIMRAHDIAVASRLFDGPVLVVLDSDHGCDHVTREMDCYSELVTPGSYMVVEDGIYHYFDPGPRHQGNFYDGDPVEAVERWMQGRADWEIDRHLEDARPCTLNPSGYLRRRL